MRYLSDEKRPLRLSSSKKIKKIIGSHCILSYDTSHRHFRFSRFATTTNSGACVRLAEEQEISLDELTFEQLQNIDSRFEEDVMKVWDYEMSVERKSSIGGTSKARVLEQIEKCLAFASTL